MTAHARRFSRSRHSRAIILALIPLLLACMAADAQDFTGRSGAELYKRFCASCHGDQARGNGPVAKSLKVEVPDLTRIAHRQGGVFPAEQISKIIDGRKTLPPHGSRDMPVWGFEFNREDQGAGAADSQRRTDDLIARLTEYLRTLQLK
jgi:mono/diheme cytochrome c family protein